MSKFAAVLVAVGMLATLMGFSQQLGAYYLTGNIEDAVGTVITDKGEQRASFFGSVGFRVVPGQKGLILYLFEFNLITRGVSTQRGDSGVLSLRSADARAQAMAYDPRTGGASSEQAMILHYGLIDRVKGFRELGTKEEMDVFAPFTETMTGKLSARFQESLRVADKGSTHVDLGLTLELSASVLGAVRRVQFNTRVIIDWSRLFAPAQFLRIQPVFIGSGPTDPNRTGTAWSTLMAKAHELWNLCGSVRCIKFAVNAPIYLNRPEYRVLETQAEAWTLANEVDIVDAVEVFVVDRMNFACNWGGGACYSSGTASARIVTCDQQLAVPAPCPCTWCPATCPPCPPCQTGAVNPYHLAHELGHALNLAHPPGPDGGLAASTVGSNMEPSGFCCDNPNVQSAKNCRNASNPLLFWGVARCGGTPTIRD